MAQLINVKLSRFDATPWGFRLQGGKDFGAPLAIQKVNGGSPAEKAGLQAGDAVIKVNDVEVFNLRHKEAQDNIVRAGNNFEVTIQRGGSTWKPLVAPVGAVPSTPSANVQPVTKTSLAAKKHDYTPVGSAHNFAPKPFSPQVNGDATIKSIVSKQYNTPVAIYSEETIAETLSAQAEVLAGGVLGVNFKKNERNYNAANSEVFKMVHEIDNEPRTPEPAVTVLKQIPGRLPHVRHEDGNNAAPKQAFIDPRRPPQPRKPDPSELEKPRPSPVPPAVGLVGLQMLGANLDEDTDPENSKTYCFNCGVFVRIKDKNLHVECFKCATCGTSLKNVGYYNIHNKLYCDIHAKLVARQNPPAPNLEPVTVPPGGRVPGAGAISAAINAAAASAPLSAAPSLPPLSAGNMSPQPAALGPMPFHTPSAVSAPKPMFSAPSAPSATQPRPVSVNSKFVWPPIRAEEDMSTTPTATPLYIPPSHFVQPPIQQLPVQPPPVRQPPVQPRPVQPPPVQQPPIQRPQPKRETAKPQTLQSVPGSPSVYPQPYSDFLQHQPVQRPSSSLGQPLTFPQTPESTTRPRSAFSPPASKVPGANQIPQATTLIPVPGKICPQGQLPQPCDAPSAEPAPICPITQTETSYTEESLSSMESEAFRKKMSICSQEISSINDHKALSSKIEALSESLDTQMMVSSLSEAQEFDRPASPTPSKDTSPPVPRNSLVPESSQFEAAISAQTIKPVQEEPCIQVTANESKPTSTKVVTFEPPQQVQPMQIRETKRTVVEESSSQSTQISQTKSFVKQQTTTARRESGGSSETKSSVTQQQSSSIAQQSSSSVSTVKSVVQQESGIMSSVTDIAPAQSQLLAALTTAPTRPYSPLPSATAAPTASTTTPAQPSKPYKEAPKPSTGFKPIAQTQQQESLQEIQQKSSTTSLVAALTIAPDRPYSPLPSSAQFGTAVPLPKPVLPYQPKADIAAPRPEACQSPMVAALTIAPERSYSPLPGSAQIVNPVPLPKPIPSQPKADVVDPRPEACQSPMISALTIAPERSYSPLPGATKFQETAPTQTPSQTQPPTLPVSSGRISMLSALTIAPDSPYSALPPATQAPFSATTQTQKKQETSAFKSVPQRKMQQPPAAPTFTPIMAPSKPTARFAPPDVQRSSFLPISAESAPRPVTPVPHVPAGLPVPAPARSRSATPSQPRRPGSATGLQKPATIPYYQQQMLEYPFQPPRSATPISCPMISDPTSTQTLAPQDAATIPRLRSPSPSVRGWRQESGPQPPDTISQLPKGPATPSQIQPKPLPQTVQKPVAPQPLQKSVVLQQAQNISQQPQQKSTAPQSQPLPFPNIPLPQGTAKKLPTTQANIPAFKPTPMDLPTPKFAPQSTAAPLASSIETKIPVPPNASTVPSAGGAAPGGGGSKKGAAFAGATAPRRGRGVLNQPTSLPAGARIPLCGHCNGNIRGPFITALGKIWCPEHFVCVNAQCRRQLADIGFVEEQGGLYCEYCFEQYLAPPCDKCTKKIKGDCVNAIGKHYHPECFVCAYCSKLFGNNPFFLEDGLPYCETDWNELFTTKCFACGFPIEAGDRWVEALSNNYHSQCFNCTSCKKNLEGQSFFAKGGRPFCKTHAR